MFTSTVSALASPARPSAATIPATRYFVIVIFDLPIKKSPLTGS
jgi:hypothetical protein